MRRTRLLLWLLTWLLAATPAVATHIYSEKVERALELALDAEGRFVLSTFNTATLVLTDQTTGFTVTLLPAALTASRLVTLPDADANPIRPLACGGTDKVSAISAAGVITCTADAGGSSTLLLAGTSAQAGTVTVGTATHTQTYDYTAAFTTGTQFLLHASGNPTGGTFFEVRSADPDITLAKFGDGTNAVTVNAAGLLVKTGTGSIRADSVAPTAANTNGVLYLTSATAFTSTAQGGTNTVLAANAGAPAFSATPTLTSLTLAAATNQLTLGTTNTGTLSMATLSASRVWTFPNVAGTVITTGDTGSVTNTMLAGSIADSKLSQLTTASKVAGSAVQLATDPGLEDSTGLRVKVAASKFIARAAAGLSLDDALCVNGEIPKKSGGVWACGSDNSAGSPNWDTLGNPSGNQALSMLATQTTWTWGAATGANNLFNLTDTASNTGTGYLVSVSTATGSTAKPLRVAATGTSNGIEMTTVGLLQKIGTGSIQADAVVCTTCITLTTEVTGTLPVVNGGTEVTTFTSNGVLYGNGASAVQVTAQGGTNTILTASAGAPAWSATPIVNTSLQLGVVSTATGSLKLAHVSSANLTTLTAGNAVAARTYIWPTDFGSAGTVLMDAAGDGTLSWGSTSTNDANKALSNLAAVAINTALLPSAAAGADFGSATLPWKDLYLAGTSGTPGTNNFKLTGASTSGTRVITLPDASTTLPVLTQVVTLSGPTAARTYTFPDTSTTVLTTNAAITVAQGGTGVGTFATNGVLYGNGTTSVLATAQGGTNTILTASAGAPAWSATPIINTSVQLGVVSTATGALKLAHASSANLTTLQAGNATSAVTYTWPTADGTNGQVLSTNASGVLSWTAAAATAYVYLPMAGATLPDASGTGNNAPAPARRVSTGSQTAETPKATWAEYAFDATTDEHLLWDVFLPGDYASGGTIRLTYKATSATSGTVIWKTSIGCSIDGTTAMNALVFNAATTVSSTVPGTAGLTKTETVALTTTNMAANRFCAIFVGRDASADSATGDAELVMAQLEYTR